MNLRPPNLIHGLTFDISLSGTADDGEALADMIKASLLPVMDQVLSQCDQPNQLRRIEQLEIDLGTVSQDDSAGELARRLFDRLSEALQWPVDGDEMAGGTGGMPGSTGMSGVNAVSDERAAPPGELLLRFLRTGRLASWLVNETGDAHRQLLRQVLELPQALEVLRTAVNDEQMLIRLVRQFDATSLRSVAALLTSAMPAQARALAPQVPDSADETDWRGLLRVSLISSAIPVTAAKSTYRSELHDLQSMLTARTEPQRAALQSAWTRLIEAVRQRLGGRQVDALNPQAKADLALITRQHADQLFDGFDAAEVNTLLRLLQAGDDVAAVAGNMLAPTHAQIPDAATIPVATIAATATTVTSTGSEALLNLLLHGNTGAKGHTEARDVQPTPASQQEHQALLTLALEGLTPAQYETFTEIWHRLSTEITRRTGDRALSALSAQQNADLTQILRPLAAELLAGVSDQHDAFTTIWQCLSSEINRRADGRTLSTLSAQQKADLANLLRPLAIELLENFGDTWTQAHTEATLRLLLETDDTRAEVATLLASMATAPANATTTPVSGTHHAPSNLTTAEEVRPPAPRIAALQAALRAEEAVVSRDVTAAPASPQECRTLLANALSILTSAQHEKFAAIWQRLSSEISHRAGSRAPSALNAQQKADIKYLLRPRATELLVGFADKWMPSHIDATLNLLLATDSAPDEITALLAGVATMPADSATITASGDHRAPSPSRTTEKIRPPTPHISALQAALRAEEAAAGLDATTAPASLRESQTLIVQALVDLTSVQYEAFAAIWHRLSSEIVRRTDGHALATLSSQKKADLTHLLRPIAGELLAGFSGDWTPSHTEAVLNLLLTTEDAPTEIAALLARAAAMPANVETTPASDERRVSSDLTAPPHAIPPKAQQVNSPAPHIAALQAALSLEQAAASRDAVPAPASLQEHRALLANVLSGLSAIQRDAFATTLQRLSSEIGHRTGGLELTTLSGRKKTDLTPLLRPLAVKLLTGFAEQWTVSHTDATLALLLSGDDGRAEVEAMFTRVDATAGTVSPREFSHPQHEKPDHAWPRIAEATAELLVARDASTAEFHAMLSKTHHNPAPRAAEQETPRGAGAADNKAATPDHTIPTPLPEHQQPQVEVDRFSMHHGTSRNEISHSQQAGLALLTRIWRSFDAARRTAFQALWQRLSAETTNRTGGRTVATLSTAQRTDLSALLQSVAAALLEEFALQWPGAISAEDQIALAHSAAQLALAGDDVTLIVVSLLKDQAPVADVPGDVAPALAKFHDWQQGKLDLQTQSLSLVELRQWLNWWLLHDPQLVNQDCSLMLSAIEAQVEQSDDPVDFMKRVLASLQSGDALDLEALSRQSGAPVDITLTEAPQSRSAIRQFITGQGAQTDRIDAAQMQQLVRAWLGQERDDTTLFMTAIEEHAAQAASPQAFLLAVLQQLIVAQPIDLEQLLANEVGSTSSTADRTQMEEDDPAPQVPSTLPAQLRQALPKRLASAMLQADFASLEIIWPDLVQSHAAELAEAARHYLARSDVRERLVAHTDTAMLKDLLGALSVPAMRRTETMLQHSLQYGAMLSSPLSPDEFEQRTLRFALEQALTPQLGALEWLRGLTASLQTMNDEQRVQLEHAWYEVLRTGQQPTRLLDALEHELFDPSAQARGASEGAVSILLMRDADMDATERAGLASTLQHVLAKDGVARQGKLEAALAAPRAIERLADAVPGAGMARLFATLRPEVAGSLPILLRQLKKALPISFSAVPAMLDRRIWKAIYLTAFAEHATTAASENLLTALVSQLADQYQADAAAWLDKATKATSQAMATESTAAIKPEQAMAQLLQPWAEAKPAPARKPQPAKRPAAEEEQSFTGEANIHNAGLVIVIPYVQRLFGILELTVDGKFVSDEAAERAVHLLQYVVTGEESTPEYQLVLNKLLCGIHGGTPIVPGISITDKEKTIIEQMLNGVITHWSALGKTSIAGLRETFLQRQGHLFHQDEAWHLKIPQKSFDMLIDRLPWSFAMTRMPWMAEPLNVTWRG